LKLREKPSVKQRLRKQEPVKPLYFSRGYGTPSVPILHSETETMTAPQHPPMEALKQWWPILLSVVMGLTGLGAMYANMTARFDSLEQRVAGLELDRQHEREAMSKVLDAIQRTDRRLALWICSQDPKRCAE
jgi:hypothetical protein